MNSLHILELSNKFEKLADAGNVSTFANIFKQHESVVEILGDFIQGFKANIEIAKAEGIPEPIYRLYLKQLEVLENFAAEAIPELEYLDAEMTETFDAITE